MMRNDDIPDDAPVYVISVAAELSGLHPQTLRQYDRLGLVRPRRSGRYRLYSTRDIRRLLHIQDLSEEGLNLAGIAKVLDLTDRVRDLEERLSRYEEHSSSTALVVWRPHQS